MRLDADAAPAKLFKMKCVAIGYSIVGADVNVEPIFFSFENRGYAQNFSELPTVYYFHTIPNKMYFSTQVCALKPDFDRNWWKTLVVQQ